MGIKQTDISKEICRRENTSSREVNITDVSRILRHLFNILSEQEPTQVKEFINARLAYYRRKPK